MDDKTNKSCRMNKIFKYSERKYIFALCKENMPTFRIILYILKDYSVSIVLPSGWYIIFTGVELNENLF